MSSITILNIWYGEIMTIPCDFVIPYYMDAWFRKTTLDYTGEIFLTISLLNSK